MDHYSFEWSVVDQYMSWLLLGLRVTILVAVVSMALAMVLGLIVAVLRMSRFVVVRSLAAGYISFIRGLPLLVFLLWLYFGLALVTGINISAMTAAIVCLVLQYAAWLAEVYRSGLAAVPRGQAEAALATGLTRWQCFRKVIMPQAWAIILPPLGNNFVGILKDTSLVSVIGVADLMKKTQEASDLSFRPFELFTVTALIYIFMSFVIARVTALLEKRATRHLQRPRVVKTVSRETLPITT